MYLVSRCVEEFLYRGKCVVKETKTVSSVRVIPITNTLCTLIKKARNDYYKKMFVKGEDFVAYMVLEDNVLVADVMEAIRRHRPSIEWPKSIFSIPMLPLTECSKVDKRKLKEWYNKG